MAIVPINLSIPPVAVAPSAAPAPSSGNAFGAAFAEAVSKVETFRANAQASVDRFLSGEGEELHQVALKAQQADIAFELFTQVRNKVVAAYQEVMRMQVRVWRGCGARFSVPGAPWAGHSCRNVRDSGTNAAAAR